MLRSTKQFRLSILPKDTNMLALAGARTHGLVILSPALFDHTTHTLLVYHIYNHLKFSASKPCNFPVFRLYHGGGVYITTACCINYVYYLRLTIWSYLEKQKQQWRMNSYSKWICKVLKHPKQQAVYWLYVWWIVSSILPTTMALQSFLSYIAVCTSDASSPGPCFRTSTL